MFLVGLTGGIAAGKSAVATCWQSLGADVIDSDDLAREVVAKGTEALQEITSNFGETVLTKDGNLNRSALANLVFASVEARAKLESITHPRIRRLAIERIGQSSAAVVVYVIPLLVESKSELPFDFVVTVEAPEKDQVLRMVESRGMTEEQAIARISVQAKPAERANVANRILNSNQSLVLLLKDAKTLWREIEQQAARKKSNNVS